MLSLMRGYFDKEKIRAWIRISKPFKHQTMIYPFLLGTAIAWSEIGGIDWTIFIISFIALLMMVEAAYISNDYFDFGTDILNPSKITGGSKVLCEGLLEKEEVLKTSVILILSAIPLGIVLQFYFRTGILTLPLGAFGMFLAYSYSGKPLRLSYRGLGEVSLALNNSWTPIFAGYYLQIHQVHWLPTIVSIPYILGVFSQKLLREFPDIDADRSSGRRNLVVIFGKERCARIYIVSLILMFLSFISLLFIDINRLSLLLLLIPIFFLSRNLIAVYRRKWKSLKDMEFLDKNGFIGMFCIPISLICIFLLRGM
ncbi:MAG: UbiA family prenyltransferase [Candidatus Syntropharchaeia archaeon]